MRAWTLFVVALFAAGGASRGDDEIVTPQAADCTFHADQVRSAPEMWHRLSQIAEAQDGARWSHLDLPFL